MGMKRNAAHGLLVLSVFLFIAIQGQPVSAQGDDGGSVDDLPGMDAADPASTDPATDDASAETSMDGMGDSPTMGASGTRLTLPKGQIYAQGFLEINLSKDGVFKPVSIRPDVWYGVNDDLTVGLGHSTRALSGFLVDVVPGGGLCLGATTIDEPDDTISCARGRYNTIGALARYHLLDSPVILAVDGGLVINDFDPFALALKLGVVGEWMQSEKLAVLFGLNLNIAVAGREDNNPFSKEFLNIPVSVMYQINAKLSAGAQTGFRTPFSDAGDAFSIPLSLGARYMLKPNIILDGSFGFPYLVTGVKDANGDNSSGVAARVLNLGAGYVF